MKILGISYDSKLTFRTHIIQLDRIAAGKLAFLRRTSWLLHSKGRKLLYKSQVRSLLLYSCLVWGGAAASHLAILDKFQYRAKRIIWDGHPEQQMVLHNLQH